MAKIIQAYCGSGQVPSFEIPNCQRDVLAPLDLSGHAPEAANPVDVEAQLAALLQRQLTHQVNGGRHVESVLGGLELALPGGVADFVVDLDAALLGPEGDGSGFAHLVFSSLLDVSH